jgi:excisionase family DNA binding protein
MSEKFFVTNYDRDELVLMIREAFKVELIEHLKKQERESDYNILLSRKEVAEYMKISIPTLHNYQKSGILKYHRVGSRILFMKGEVMEALQLPIKYRRWNDRRF